MKPLTFEVLVRRRRQPTLILLAVAITFLSVNITAKWSTSVSKDEMTGKKSAYAISDRASPTKQLSFPYSDVKSSLGFGCDGRSEWVYAYFTTSPNLTSNNIKEGYTEITTRFKWGEESPVLMTLTQEWGAKFLHFSNDAKAIQNIEKNTTVLLELPWFGDGNVYFRFDLTGAKAAIQQARLECSSGN